MDVKTAHVRNLHIQVLRVISNKEEISQKYKIQDIKEKLFFRECDISDYLNIMFLEDKDGYIFTEEDRKIMQKYLSNHRINTSAEMDELINKALYEYKVFLSKLNLYQYNNKDFEQFYNKIEKYIEKIHWYTLPIYEDKFICDRGQLPEDNVKEYYRDFYTLKDLMEWLKNGYKTWKPSLKGDCNFNKELRFRVYSRRWGHYDSYTIKRTLTGWYVDFMSFHKDCEKNGNPILFACLNHDYILYSRDGLEEAMETLWDLADASEMSVMELQEKIDDIAIWISEIEKAHANYKPDWLLY